MARVAVIFINYGPYHVARAKALAQVEDIQPTFVQLGSRERNAPGAADTDAISGSLVTLTEGYYEQCPQRILDQELVAALESCKPDVVAFAGYGLKPMRTAARWAKANGKGTVLMSATTEVDHARVWWREMWKRWWIGRHCDAGFVGGTASRKYLARLGMRDDRIWEGYDVVDNEYFARRADEVRLKAEHFRDEASLPQRYFLYVGRLSAEKNLVRLLRGYRQYRDGESYPWGLVLVGEGAHGGTLTALAKDLSLEDVVWAGLKQLSELPPYYASAGGFVLPSTSEPWGLVVNEAMACGLPVLVSRLCGSAADLVEEGKNGYTFDPYDASEIAERMSTLTSLGEAERAAMGQRSLQIVAAYTPETFAKNLTECILYSMARHAA